MNILVLYDSLYGNTRKVAHAIGDALQAEGAVQVRNIEEVPAETFLAPDLLIVGAPTHRFQPSPAIQHCLHSLPADSLRGIKVAAFDTRIDPATIRSGVLRFMVKTGGFAARKIEKQLKRKGGLPVIAADGFTVTDTKGPLLEGEMKRAADWGRRIAAVVSAGAEAVG